MLSPEQLDNWTMYHAPDEVTQPKYDDIRASEAVFHMLLAKLGDPKLFDDPPRDPAVLVREDCDLVNAAARDFLMTIDRHAPDSADKTAAFRCVRLARNAANEWIMSCVVGFPLYINSLLEARRQLVLARWQACGAIACEGK